MKKILLFAVAAATLGLGACNRSTCPAYSSAKSASAPVTASSASSVSAQ